MIKNFESVTANRFHKIFPVIAPCDCHQEELGTKYDIRVITGADNLHVTNVRITCKTCGDSRTFSVLQSITINNVTF